MGGIGLDLTAQARHPDIDGAIKGGPLGAGQQIQELIPIEHPVGMLGQYHQQIKFSAGINCHRETEVKTANGYYANAEEGTQTINERLAAKFHDESITVEKIGGLECGKCHY